MASQHQLPHKPHPIASAFFDAHDDELVTTNADNANRSSAVAKIRNSIGWRTRYSSSSLYPVSVLPVEERRREEDEGESVLFHVRQVFPGESHRHRGKACDNDVETKLQQQLHDPVSEDDCEFGTGAAVWPGSIILLKYLEKMAHDPHQDNILEGKTVADLGSGTAITSIASALLGASLVVCTDGCDPVVDLARQNIHDAISHLGSGGELSPTSVDSVDEPIHHQHCDFRGCTMMTQKYRWGEGMLLEGIDQSLIHDTDAINVKMQSRTTQFDLILGADCIVPKLYPIEPLVDAIDELSAPQTVSYISYEQRHYEHFDPAVEFRRLADLRNLEVEIVPDQELHPMYPANDIQIWKVSRKNKLCANANMPKKLIQNVCPIGKESSRSNHKSLLVGKHS